LHHIMRHNYLLYKTLTIILFIIMSGVSGAKAQDTIHRFDVTLHLTHFIAKEQDWFWSYFPINPAIEILYRLPLNRKNSVLAGANYTYSLWEYTSGTSSKWKRSAHEVAFPLLIEHTLGQRTSVTLGSYMVWLVSGKQLNINKFTTHWIDQTASTGYDESSKITFDLYLDFGFRQKVTSKHSIKYSPFIKYKIKDHWMDYVRAKTCFGLKITFN
jgi:hypothetical protein